MAYCSACGKAVAPDAAFCSSCGAALAPHEEPPAWAQPAPGSTPHAPATAAPEADAPAAAGAAFDVPPPPPPLPAGAAGAYPAGPYPPAPAGGTNGFAIAALVCSIALVWFCGLGAILGIVFGNVALKQIRQTGQQGEGMAKAGIIIGWVFVGLWVLYLILVIVSLASSSSS